MSNGKSEKENSFYPSDSGDAHHSNYLFADFSGDVNHLPKSEKASEEKKVEIAEDAGFELVAVNHALAPAPLPWLKVGGTAVVLSAILLLLFPWSRLQGSLEVISDPEMDAIEVTQELIDNAESKDKEWLSFLFKVQKKNANEYNESLVMLREKLDETPLERQLAWEHVYLEYWQMLYNRENFEELNSAAGCFFVHHQYPTAAIYWGKALINISDEPNNLNGALQALSQSVKFLSQQSPVSPETEKMLTKLRITQSSAMLKKWELGGCKDADLFDRILEIVRSREEISFRRIEIDAYKTFIEERFGWFSFRKKSIGGEELDKEEVETKIEKLEDAIEGSENES